MESVTDGRGQGRRPRPGAAWMVLALLALAAMAHAGTASAVAASAQATVAEVEGRVVARRGDGRSRTLREEMVVFASETIATGPDSRVLLRFSDGSRFDLGASTQMLIKDYVYDDRETEGSLVTRIFQGTFRFVSGAVARLRSRSMRVELPVAVIGIRGTRVAGEASATSALVVLLEPETPGDTAIEVANEYGSVVVDRPGWGTEVPDAESPPSPPRRMRGDTLQRLNRSMQTLRRVITPRMRPLP